MHTTDGVNGVQRSQDRETWDTCRAERHGDVVHLIHGNTRCGVHQIPGYVGYKWTRFQVSVGSSYQFIVASV